MNDNKWLKLSNNLFFNPKISKILSMRFGHRYLCLWIYLLTYSSMIRREGALNTTDAKGFDVTVAARHTGLSKKQVEEGLQIFLEMEMLSEVDGVLLIKNWGKYQSAALCADGYERRQELSRQRAAGYRERKRVSRVRYGDFDVEEAFQNAIMRSYSATESDDSECEESEG